MVQGVIMTRRVGAQEFVSQVKESLVGGKLYGQLLNFKRPREKETQGLRVKGVQESKKCWMPRRFA